MSAASQNVCEAGGGGSASEAVGRGRAGTRPVGSGQGRRGQNPEGDSWGLTLSPSSVAPTIVMPLAKAVAKDETFLDSGSAGPPGGAAAAPPGAAGADDDVSDDATAVRAHNIATRRSCDVHGRAGARAELMAAFFSRTV